jgi:hypothetical protein
LPSPILDLVTKRDLRNVRGFAGLRMVAPDHFVRDDVLHNQEYTRDLLCKAERSLRFMLHTGLRPLRRRLKRNEEFAPRDKLPGMDHATEWVDPREGQFILIDEPYEGAPDYLERAAWAERTGWKLGTSSWPGMYRPYDCGLHVCIKEGTSYDLDTLLAAIDAIPAPVVAEAWSGISASGWETFLSPQATTKQERRRARAKGTIEPVATRTTIPYSAMFGISRRRPAGVMKISDHQEVGRIIKAALRSALPAGAWNRLTSLRSELEDWMACEIARGELDGPEFFDVYYSQTDHDDALLATMTTPGRVIAALQRARARLVKRYPDCAPLRQQLHRLDMSIEMIARGGGSRAKQLTYAS